MSDMTRMMEEANWSDLPDDLLNTIGHRLIKLKDFTRLQAVCKPWSRALAGSKFRQSIPWLMLPYCRNDSISDRAGCKGTDSCRCFYDFQEERFHHIELPQGLNRTCRGSGFGWVFMTEKSPSMFLLNPLTKDQIALPPTTGFPEVLGFRPEQVGREYLFLDWKGFRVAQGKKLFEKRSIWKVALSAEPTSEECVVMIIRAHYWTLAFCRPDHDQKWTEVVSEYGVAFADVVFWRGQFYVVDDRGKLYVCDLSLPHCPKLSRLVHQRHPSVQYSYCYYLATSPSHDELMMVTRFIRFPDDDDDGDYDDGDYDDDDGDDDGLDDDLPGDVPAYYGGVDSDDDEPDNYGDGEVDRYNIDSDSDDPDHIQLPNGGRRRRLLLEDYKESPVTIQFKVFKLNKGGDEWEEVESIGDFALFLGFNTTTWVSTKDHPEFAPNSIYFIDDLFECHKKRKLGGADTGVYNLAAQTVTPFYCTASVHKNPLLISPLPMWVLPSNY